MPLSFVRTWTNHKNFIVLLAKESLHRRRLVVVLAPGLNLPVSKLSALRGLLPL